MRFFFVPSLSVICLSLSVGSLTAEESRLDRAKKEIHSTPAPKPNSSSTSAPSSAHHSNEYRHSSSRASDDDDDSFVGWLFQPLFDGLGFFIESRFIWSMNNPAAKVGYRDFPYADGAPDFPAPYPLKTSAPSSLFSGALYAEGNWIDPEFQRFGIGGHASISAFTLRTDWSRFIEERSDGSHSTLNIGTIDAELAIVSKPYAQLHIGLGAIISHDSYGTEGGAVFVSHVGIYPIRPVIIDGLFSYGAVGDASTDVVTARGNIGVVYQRYECYAGWQYQRIGSFSFDGPLAGLRLWF
jgi:hypothetical protein